MKWQRVGHRGAPREFPGNTLSGFRRAVELGCTMVECDIRQAADGELVLAHDPVVADVTGRTYVVAEHTSTTLASLNLGAGEGAPILASLVEWAVGRCAIMTDMKCEGNGVEDRVVAALASLPGRREACAWGGNGEPAAVSYSRCRPAVVAHDQSLR